VPPYSYYSTINRKGRDMNTYKEIEVRFLEIDKDALVARLGELGAEDTGETMLSEVICYDEALHWRDEQKFIRLRKKGDVVHCTYKDQSVNTIDGTEEIEIEVSDMAQAELLLERMGYPAYRHQEKKRHTFILDGVFVEIDTWPKIPTYVELEGGSEQALREVAEKLGFDWADAVVDNARMVIENHYDIPVGTMKWFTFERFE